MTMTTGDAQATIAAVATLRDITEAELRRIRKADGKVAARDVISAVTGQGAAACKGTWPLTAGRSCSVRAAGS